MTVQLTEAAIHDTEGQMTLLGRSLAVTKDRADGCPRPIKLPSGDRPLTQPKSSPLQKQLQGLLLAGSVNTQLFRKTDAEVIKRQRYDSKLIRAAARTCQLIEIACSLHLVPQAEHLHS